MDPDPHHFGNPDLDPHQSDTLDGITSQNVWKMSLFEQFFKGLEARIRIRIHIRVKAGSGFASNKNQDPDLQPDTHRSDADPQN